MSFCVIFSEGGLGWGVEPGRTSVDCTALNYTALHYTLLHCTKVCWLFSSPRVMEDRDFLSLSDLAKSVMW